ncbi:MAG: ATP-dependent DNA ligase [Ginsengibacter sp.]
MSSKEKKAAINRILKDAQKAEMPSAVNPMNFKLRPAAFDSEDWIFEIKWDGFRMLSFNSGSEVKLRSRNNSSFDKRFNSIKEELQSMNLKAVLDGEVVALDESGCSDFDKLLSGEKNCIAYYVFDILWYDGFSLMNLPLLKRKELLKLILPESDKIHFSDHVETNGKDLFELAKNHNIEGIVGKQKESVYVPGTRTSQWLKIKTAKVTEGIVAGLLLDKDKGGSGFSSLIVGVEEKGVFKYLGLVEAGITKTYLQSILKQAKASEKSIFNPAPNVNKNSPFRKKIKNPEVIWLEPTLHCKVKFLELDKFGIMRHASFKGLIAA